MEAASTCVGYHHKWGLGGAKPLNEGACAWHETRGGVHGAIEIKEVGGSCFSGGLARPSKYRTPWQAKGACLARLARLAEATQDSQSPGSELLVE